jgi:hypothetical protein
MTAPPARRVDMLNGHKAPDKYFQALSEADEFIRQLDRGTVAQADADDAAETIGGLLHERDGLACRVQELETELDARTTERDHWRGIAHRLMATDPAAIQ